MATEPRAGPAVLTSRVVLLAKLYGSCIVQRDALRDQEFDDYPYLGPSMEWDRKDNECQTFEKAWTATARHSTQPQDNAAPDTAPSLFDAKLASMVALRKELAVCDRQIEMSMIDEASTWFHKPFNTELMSLCQAKEKKWRAAVAEVTRHAEQGLH